MPNWLDDDTRRHADKLSFQILPVLDGLRLGGCLRLLSSAISTSGFDRLVFTRSELTTSL